MQTITVTAAGSSRQGGMTVVHSQVINYMHSAWQSSIAAKGASSERNVVVAPQVAIPTWPVLRSVEVSLLSALAAF